ncbi:MAG: CoA-binding protein [Clostridiales bacterium]|nr:CoA-binding protein [Clostridiales bacterium]
MLEEEMLAQKAWAVVGANQNPEKYGHIIYAKLKRKGYRVYAVNPRYESIDGEPCYAALSDLPERVAVVNMVVAPKAGRAYIEEAAQLGVPYVWFQPGTFSDELGLLADRLGLKYVQACALVATR